MSSSTDLALAFVESLDDDALAVLAERLAPRLAQFIEPPEQSVHADPWMTTKEAAEYLRMHPKVLQRYVSAGTVPYYQDGPNCALSFKRSELDAWRMNGGIVRAA